MRIFLIIAAFLLSACTAPIENTQPKGQQLPTAGEHIPPPGFPNQSPITSDKDRICSGMIAGTLETCRADEFCYIPTGQYCGAADYPGVCRPKPEICTKDYRAVCGCDGKTYSNECVANANGVSISSKGECK